MADDERVAGAAPLATRKRGLPFKRTAARRPVPDPFADEPEAVASQDKSRDDDDGLSLFRRSDKVFPRAVEEQERRARTKEPHKRRPEEKDGLVGDKKRARPSLEGEDGTDPSRRSRSPANSETHGAGFDARERERPAIIEPKTPSSSDRYVRPEPSTPVQHITPPSTASSRDRGFGGDAQTERESAFVIPGDDEVDDAGPPADPKPLSTSKMTGESESDIEVIEDPNEVNEYEHYIIKAREREAARKAAAEAAAAEKAMAARNASSGPVVDSEFSESTALHLQKQQERKDAVITILITTSILGCVELRFKRKLSQDMKIVIETWIAGQEARGVVLPENIRQVAFLTWKGNKIYSTTTAESLDLDVDVDGRITPRKTSSLRYSGVSDADDSGYRENGLHLRMWTPELYDEYARKKERERLKSLGEWYDNDEEDEEDDRGGNGLDSGAPDGAPAEEKGEKIRLILKAKGGEPARILAYSQTPVHVVAAAFRVARSIAENVSITLRFDGDELDGETLLGDTEIEDMDSVEVYLK